jgi:glycosyltransferase involved in cell wall biosynthesis
MDKAEFLTIFPTFENLSIVKKTLPSVIEETKRNDAKLIVHDSSVRGREEKWQYLQALNKNNDFFLLLSSNLSMGHARNMCMAVGQELYAPDYICVIDDDHGYQEGLIPHLIKAMKKYYGKMCPNGLRYGMFTGCDVHTRTKRVSLGDGFSYPSSDNDPKAIGGSNNCFRCAPTSHWVNVLKGWDTDEYLISLYQTVNIRGRNYHKGFTVLFVEDGPKSFEIDYEGRGLSKKGLKLWDDTYTASDARSKFRKD